MSDLIQELMDAAYKRWQDHNESVDNNYNLQWDQQQFWDQLSEAEEIAVYVGNLNYQVENGGFQQWVDNGYGECWDKFKPILKNMGYESTSNMARLIEDDIIEHYKTYEEICKLIATRLCGEYEDWIKLPDTDWVDNQYYDRYQKQFLLDVEDHLKTIYKSESSTRQKRRFLQEAKMYAQA